jgi:serine/threonine protein kinase/formylglycine-generating enzyme required for sulfatase activity
MLGSPEELPPRKLNSGGPTVRCRYLVFIIFLAYTDVSFRRSAGSATDERLVPLGFHTKARTGGSREGEWVLAMKRDDLDPEPGQEAPDDQPPGGGRADPPEQDSEDRGSEPVGPLGSEATESEKGGPETREPESGEHGPGKAGTEELLPTRVIGPSVSGSKSPPSSLGMVRRAGGAGESVSSRRDAPPPDFIGPYRILKKLGRGGQGVVYLAEQEDLKPHFVAIKVILLGLDTEEARARFDGERRALLLLNHPRIAGILDHGETESGQPYFVMEYVPGDPLTTFCDDHQLGLEERLRLFQQLCEGVQYLHSKQIVHRDLTPRNILVTKEGDVAELKIIDFGLAKALDGRLTDREGDTQLGAFMGTPEYMSPEQTRGPGREPNSGPDTRTDIYSLGALLFELLAGVPPFVFSSEGKSRDFVEISRRIRTEDPRPPSKCFAGLEPLVQERVVKNRRTLFPRLKRKLERELDWVVLHALEKDPDARFQTAEEFGKEVDRYLSGKELLVSHPPSWSYRLRKFSRKYKEGLITTAFLFLALGVGFGWALVERGNAQRERDRVLRFSDNQRLLKLRRDATTLWPAGPQKIPALESWLNRATTLLERRPWHEDSHRRLRQKAQASEAPSGEEPLEVRRLREEVEWMRSLESVIAREDPQPLPPLREQNRRANPDEILKAAEELWQTVAPDRFEPAKVGSAGALAAHWTDLVLSPDGGDWVLPPQFWNTIAWANYRTGRLEAAREAADRAVEGSDKAVEVVFSGFRDLLEARIQVLLSEGAEERLQQQISALERVITRSQRRHTDEKLSTFLEGTDLGWQLSQSSELINKLEEFDGEEGLVAEVRSRLSRARSVETNTISGPEAQRRWAEAINSIADQEECPAYQGLRLKPQLGLLPLDRNPRTGLWEFYHMESGMPPERNQEWDPETPGKCNRWSIKHETGIVFVLIPGGVYSVGAIPPFGVTWESSECGLKVKSVREDSPWVLAGLQAEDRLYSINGSIIETMDQLIASLAALKSGETCRLEVVRQGEERSISARLEGGFAGPQVNPWAEADEGPLQSVELDPYFLSKYEMTQGQWARSPADDPRPSHYKAGAAPGFVQFIEGHNPVENINYEESRTVLRNLGLTLPTEVQWEVGCRGMSTSVFWSGGTVQDLLGVANIGDAHAKRLVPAWTCSTAINDGMVVHDGVGNLRANGFGLHDVHGGVWEWCLDAYVRYEDRPASSGSGLRSDPAQPKLRVVRGGGFKTNAASARSANRLGHQPSRPDFDLGLRPARTVEK